MSYQEQPVSPASSQPPPAPPAATTPASIPPTPHAEQSLSRARHLKELAGVFLKLGLIGFGGPAAHVGLMEQELIRRRQWLTHEKFADLLAAANLIPGPNSTEMAIYVGQMRAGFPGLVVAGACFILPAMLSVMAIAWGYQRFGTLPAVGGLLFGVKPVILAIIAQALWGLAGKAVKTPWHAGLGLAALTLGFLGINELLLLLGTGLVAPVLLGLRQKTSGKAPMAFIPWPLLPGRNVTLAAVATGTGTGAAVSFGLLPLFLFFLKVGAVLYGSGYVLFAFLHSDLVERWHWLSESQLFDAIAVGQITPGPLFTTATFIGYVLGGPWAGLLATLGIFLPAFIFVAISGPLIPRLRSSALAGAFLDGVVVASLALMAVVTWHLGRAALYDVTTVVVALISLGLLIRFRVNSAWLVLGGAVLGLVGSLAGLIS